MKNEKQKPSLKVRTMFEFNGSLRAGLTTTDPTTSLLTTITLPPTKTVKPTKMV